MVIILLLINQNLIIRAESFAPFCKLDIEIGGIKAGEIDFHDLGNKTAQFGIEIFGEDERNKGYGTKLLKIFISELLRERGYERIVLDVEPDNARARHVYEKLGFKVKSERDIIYYELLSSKWGV